jgi:hypothetical protein
MFDITGYKLVDVLMYADIDAPYNRYGVYKTTSAENPQIQNDLDLYMGSDVSDYQCLMRFTRARICGSPDYENLTYMITLFRPHLVHYIALRLIRDVPQDATFAWWFRKLKDTSANRVHRKYETICRRIFNCLPHDTVIFEKLYNRDPYVYDAFNCMYQPCEIPGGQSLEKMLSNGTIGPSSNIVWTKDQHRHTPQAFKDQVKTFLLIRNRLLKRFIARDLLPNIFVYMLFNVKDVEREIMKRRYERILKLQAFDIRELTVQCLDLKISPYMEHGTFSKICIAAMIVDRQDGLIQHTSEELVTSLTGLMKHWRSITNHLDNHYYRDTNENNIKRLLGYLLEQNVKLSTILDTRKTVELIYSLRQHERNNHPSLKKQKQL